MKKSLLALAVLGAFAGAASAQSSVTLYGVADANFTSQKGGSNTLSSMGSGGLQGSRWGMRGTEDLGGGLKANFALESGYAIDTGSSLQGGRLFGRAAWVGVSGGFGEVRLGRHLTPIGIMTDETGPMSTKPGDIMTVAGTLGANSAYRTDNSLNYMTPNLGGLTAHLQYSTQVNGSEVAGLNKNVGQHMGLSVMYKGGPIVAGLGYLEIKDTVAEVPPSLVGQGNQKATGLFVFGGYDFGVAAVKLAYNKDDLKLAKDPTTVGVSVDAPLGPVVLSAAFAMVKDSKGSDAGPSDDANIYTIQAVYSLSKRTALYAFYTGVDNDAGANLGFNSPALDKRSSQIQLGLRHRF